MTTVLITIGLLVNGAVMLYCLIVVVETTLRLRRMKTPSRED